MATKTFVDSFPAPTEVAFWLYLYFTESVGIILINIITIITFSVNRQAFGRSVYVFINLAVSDMLYGVSLAVFVQFYANSWPVNNVPRYLLLRGILLGFVLVSSIASAVSIFLVAIDRFLAIFAPFRYRVTEPKVYGFVIVICWFSCICVGTAQFMTPSKYMHILRYFLCMLRIARAGGNHHLIYSDIHQTERTKPIHVWNQNRPKCTAARAKHGVYFNDSNVLFLVDMAADRDCYCTLSV